MAGREPAWFRPEPFGREVLHFAFRQLDAIPLETVENLNRYPEDFRTAVETVGKAVFTLQLLISNRLRPLFIESINLAAHEGRRGIYEEIVEFMSQGYLHKDIFKATLTCFAIVAELVLFMFDFESPIPAYWYPMPWCAIYEHRLRRQLEFEGGWERLLEITKSRYLDSEFYRETLLDFRNNNPIPFAEVRRRYYWPENPRQFLRERFGVAPRSTTLAMNILREIYHDGESLTPIPRAGALDMRLMLGLQRDEDDDWA